MRKVLFLCYDLKDGGSPQVLSCILNHLHREVFDPVLVTYSDARMYPIPQGITEHVLKVRGGGNLFKKLIANLKAVFRLRRVIVHEQPEITVGMGGITNWALILAVKLTSIKTAIIIGEHGTGALAYRKERMTSSMMGPLSKLLYPSADRIVSISSGVRDYLVQDLKLSNKKLVSIANPVDVVRIKKLSQEEIDHPWFVREGEPVILWVGRIEALKGLKYLIRAFGRVQRQIDARLVIVGEGSERSGIRDLTVQEGLEKNVYFAGYQPNPYRYMSRSSVFAFPSLGGEGFPMVMVEAMACGLPVVSTDCVAGPAEILENGRCGILVPVGNEELLAEGILRILTDLPLRERLVSAAARRVTDFEAHKIVASYEQLFREVCENNSSSTPLVDQP